MTVDQIVSAIRALPLTERLRVIDLVAHGAANDAPTPAPESAPRVGVTLTERHGLLLIDATVQFPVEVFDHRFDRDGRADG